MASGFSWVLPTQGMVLLKRPWGSWWAAR